MAERDEITDLNAEAEKAMSAEDFEAAERALRQALRLQEAQLGLVHPDVVSTLNALGVVCNILGRPDEAEFLYRRAVGIARKEFTDDHPYIATSLRNLSELYRAQGKPEKFAKLSVRLAPRSGLPTVDSTSKAEGSGLSAGIGTVGTATAARAPSDALDFDLEHDHMPPPRRHTWLLRQVALLAGTSVVLFSIVWLLTVGSRSSDVRDDSQRVPGESSQAPADNRNRSAGPVPDVDVVDAIGSDEGRIASAAAAPTEVAVSADTAASVGRPIPALDDVGNSSSWAVAEARLCSQLETRGADGASLGEWRCTSIVDRAVPGQLFFYTRIRSRTSTVVVHRWLRNGSLAQQVDLEVDANDGPGYRTYSLRTIASQQGGAWRVELLSTDGELLYAEEFEVR